MSFQIPAPPDAPAASVPVPPSAPEKWTELEVSPGAAELAPGAEAIQSSQWAKAKASLKLALTKIRPTAPLDETMAGGALLGRACVALKDTTCADEAFGSVLVAEFVAVKVAAWVREQRLAIEAADAAFAKVPALADASRGILAPPRWVVAASSRTGEMKASSPLSSALRRSEETTR